MHGSLQKTLVILALTAVLGSSWCSWRATERRAQGAQRSPESLSPADPAADLESDHLIDAAYATNRSGHHREALDLFRAASRKASSPAKRLRAWVCLIDPLIQVGLYGEAQGVLDEARRVLPNVASSDLQSEMRLRMGEVRAFLGLELNDQIYEPLERWQELFDGAPPDVQKRWRLLLTRARLESFNHTHQYDRTIESGDSLTPELRGDKDVELCIGVAHWALGKDELAIQAFERVLAIPDLPDAERMQVEARLAELHWDAGREELARSYVEAARAHDAARVEDVAESFEDQLHLLSVRRRMGMATPEELEQAFTRFLKGWETSEPRPGGVPVLGAMRQRGFLTELMKARMQSQPGEAGILSALEALCRLQTLGSLARSLKGASPDPWPSFAELRSALTGERSGLALYFSGRREGLLFAVDARQVACAALPGEIELVEESRELGEWLAGDSPRSEAELRRRGERLASQLFPESLRPVMESWTEVGIVGLGHLGALPFELLPFDGRCLEERMAVSRPLSLHVLDLLRRRPDPRARGWSRDLVLLAAPPVGDLGPDGLPQLPFDDARRDGLLGGLSSERVLVRSGPEARLDGLEKELTSARMLQVLTHALRDDNRERSETLLFAGADGRPRWIHCEDLERLALPPVVVILACRSAQGPPRPGDDGVADLGGACLRAGAQVVFLAPFPLGYDDACALLRLLLEQLRSGRSPNDAVRAARRAFLAQSGTSDRTRGLIQVIGLGTRPVF